MKQLLILLLDVAAWVLGITIAPLRFILKLIWPTGKPGQTNLSLEEQPAQEEIKSPILTPSGRASFILPAKEEGEAEPIKPALKVKPGWFSLPLENLPHPTYWPVVLGLGLILGVFGVVTSFVFSLVGVILFILGLVGWIGDMWHEQSE